MPRDIQSDNEYATVKVTSGTHKDTGETTTDFIIVDKEAGGHHHVVITEDGKTVHNEFTQDKK
ncbi:MAG: hypothetical protein JNM85_04110 [Chthonomonas sp.]|nr:hypothetical protein [Chthonomonas sp.]